jgi:acyl-coenzyme A thioesterase PaaI-like protein
MDLDAVRAGLEMAVPFNQHLGLKVIELRPGRGVVALPDTAALRNHVGTQHAGGLFAAGEAASGAAFVSVFADRLDDIVPLAESARIAYRRLARGPVTATARLRDDPEELLDRLDEDGRVRFPVHVELTNAPGDVVADMEVQWQVSRRPG